MNETEWLPITDLASATEVPKAGSVVIDLATAGSNPKFGVVITTPTTPAVIQLNQWWEETKPLHVHPWTHPDTEVLLTGLEARLEVRSTQSADDAGDGHGTLSIGTDGARLRCSNVLHRPPGLGRMVINPRTWHLGAGVDSPRLSTRNWRIVADVLGRTLVLCDGTALA